MARAKRYSSFAEAFADRSGIVTAPETGVTHVANDNEGSLKDGRTKPIIPLTAEESANAAAFFESVYSVAEQRKLRSYIGRQWPINSDQDYYEPDDIIQDASLKLLQQFARQSFPEDADERFMWAKIKHVLTDRCRYHWSKIRDRGRQVSQYADGRAVLDNVSDGSTVEEGVELEQHVQHVTKHADDHDVLDSLPGDSSPDESANLEQEIALFAKSLEALPEKTRTVFLLNRFEGLKYSEIAKKLNCSDSSVQKHMMNALKAFKEWKEQRDLKVKSPTEKALAEVIDIADARPAKPPESEDESPLTYESFFAQWHPRIVNYLQKTGSSVMDAHDIAQDLFIKIYEKWDEQSKRLTGSISGYMHQIAKNQRIDYYRRKQVRYNVNVPLREQMLDQRDSSLNPEGLVASDELADIARRAQNGMPTILRQVFRSRSRDGLTYKQIGEKYGISVGTVHNRLKEAKEILQRRMELNDNLSLDDAYDELVNESGFDNDNTPDNV